MSDVKYLKPGKSYNWQESEEYAESKGGRLLTLQEARDYINSVHNGKPLYSKEDQWTAVVDQNGQKDWIQLGDRHDF